MARYYKYRRTYVKKVYPRKRWASSIKQHILDLTIPAGSTDGSLYDIVCENSVDNVTPSPVLIKFGRFKIKGDIRVSNNAAIGISSCMVYAVYVPQGVTVNDNLVIYHPEWILGWTCLSMNSGNSFSLSSTLKRNLNTGDKIVLLFVVDTLTQASQDITFALIYNMQYWTTSS